MSKSIMGYVEVKGVYFDSAVINFYLQQEEKSTNTPFSIEIESVTVEDGQECLDDMTEREISNAIDQVGEHLTAQYEGIA